jgi:hypothetical protein
LGHLSVQLITSACNTVIKLILYQAVCMPMGVTVIENNRLARLSCLELEIR